MAVTISTRSAPFTVVSVSEAGLAQRFLEGATRVPGLRVFGITDIERLDERTPTFAVSLDGYTQAAVAEALEAEGIFVWHGHYYAVEVMARLGHSTTSAAIRYQKAASERDQLIADKLDDLVAELRTAAESAEKPAAAAGFSRVSPMTPDHGPPSRTPNLAQLQGFQEHPQRDSNPCRHLESDPWADIDEW